MNRNAWKKFQAAREHYRQEVAALERKLPGLGEAQRLLLSQRRGPAYELETPLVYNGALDDVGPGDTISMILVADNPGRREQAVRRYLVGPSGKLAEGFFSQNPGLGIDFRNNVIILNKTPVHTPRTVLLGDLARIGGERIAQEIAASQRTMARLIAEFHAALSFVPVWITGYSEMKKGGIFETFTAALRELYGGTRQGETLFIYRHFSMNQFTIDLKRQTGADESAAEALARIGAAYRKRILGW